jgi:hypothetical protein
MSMSFLPTDDSVRKARSVNGMAATPQHVLVSTWENTFVAWDSAAAAAACAMPAL